jgi:hypothetical protein
MSKKDLNLGVAPARPPLHRAVHDPSRFPVTAGDFSALDKRRWQNAVNDAGKLRRPL